MSLLDTASLIVTPNGYKDGKLYSVIPSDGSGDMSVSRATTATRVNSAGLVELVPYNLLRYSQDFTQWSIVGTVNILTGVTSPIGDNTASTLSGTGDIIMTATAANGNHTFSIWAKGNIGDTFRFQKSGAFSYAQNTITIDSTEWKRYEVLRSYNAATGQIILDAFSSNISLWGAQLVEGSTAKDYQKTETRLNIPRLDYSNGTCPSLLVEPQRTNLVPYSSSFDNAAWTKINVTVTANTTTAPDGTLSADKLIESADLNQHYLRRLISFSGTNAISIYAKAAERNRIWVGNASTLEYTIFDLTNGTVVTQIGTFNSQIEDVGNGWYRCTVIDTLNTSAFLVYGIIASGTTLSYLGDGTSGVYIWGAQLEQGTYPTSYIPTTSASVTRNADVISKTGISSLIGQTEGTLFIEMKDLVWTASALRLIGISDGTQQNRVILLTGQSNNTLRAITTTGNVLQNTTTAASTFGNVKIALTYSSVGGVIYVNGSQILSYGSISVPSCSALYIQTVEDGTSFPANGYTSAAAIWPTALTNDELAQLTTI